MREFANSVLEAKDIDFQFSIQPGIYELKLNMAVRRDFFLVFKEAVNNAAKYSKATRLESTLTTGQKKLYLLVRDNGTGFDYDNAEGGNGICNMKKRAEAMRRTLTIDTSLSQGCSILLAIPIW